MATTTQGALAAASGCSAHLWQPFSNEDGHGYVEITHAAPVYTVRFNLNNKVVVSAGEVGRLFLHYGNAALMGALPAEEDVHMMEAINTTAFSRGSKLLAAGCQDGLVHVWDLKKQARRHILRDHRGAVTCVTFNPDDTQLASTSASGDVLLHGKENGNLIASLPVPDQTPRRAVQFCTVEPLLGCTGSDGSVLVWDTSTQILTDSFQALHKGGASGMTFIPGTSALLVSVGADGRVVLLDRRLDTMAACWEAALPLTSLACKDDGSSLAVGTQGGEVQLFDPRKLAAPVLKLSCSAPLPVVDLHWQHSTAGKSSRRLNLFIPTTPTAALRPGGFGPSGLGPPTESFSPLVQGTPLKTPAPSAFASRPFPLRLAGSGASEAMLRDSMGSPARSNNGSPTMRGPGIGSPVRQASASIFAGEAGRVSRPSLPLSPARGLSLPDLQEGGRESVPPDVQTKLDEVIAQVREENAEVVQELRDEMSALQLKVLHDLSLHQAETAEMVQQLAVRQEKLEASFNKLRQQVDYLVRKRDALTLWL